MRRTSSSSSSHQVYLCHILLSLLLLLLLLPVSEAQRCVKFDNSTSAATICKPYVDYDYYLPPGPTQWIIESLTSYNVHLATLQATLLPTNCEEKLQAFICANGYPKCETFDDGSITSRPVCSSLCHDVRKECSERFESSGQELPDCSSFPDKFSQVVVNGEEKKIQCFKVNNEIEIPEFPFECEWPLGYDPSVEDSQGFPCAVVCPLPFYSDAFLSAVTWTVRFTAPTMVLLLLMMLGCQLYRLDWWMIFPRRYIFYQTIFVLLAVSSYLIPAFTGGYDKMSCKSPTQTAAHNVQGCIWNNWLLIYGTWGTQQLFAIISLNVLVTVKRWTNYRFIRLLEIIYHFSILIPCGVILIVMEILKMTGYGPGFVGCFYEYREIPGLGDNGVLIVTLLLPWSLMQLFGYVFLILALFYIWKTGGGLKAIVKQTRLLLFLVIFGTSLSLGLIQPFELAIRGNEPANRYLTCEVTNWALALFMTKEEKKKLPECSTHHVSADPFSFFYNAAVHTISFGLLVFIFFFPDAWREVWRTKKKETLGIIHRGSSSRKVSGKQTTIGTSVDSKNDKPSMIS